MRRSTVFLENENSDQSISEDDDLNKDFPDNHVSLGNPAEKKGEVQILSQLDMLRDANEVIHDRSETNLLQKRLTDTCVEDDVEFPIFADKDEFTYTLGKASTCNSDEEILSDNEVQENCMQLSKCFTSEADNYQKTDPFSFGENRKNGICTWLAANAEADALINVNDNADCASFNPLSAKQKRSYKGGQGKAKHKFSIRTQTHIDNFKDSSHVYESHTSIKGKEMDEMLSYVMPAGFPVSRAHTTTSMAELLLQVQNEHDLPEGSTMKDNKRSHSDIDDDPDCLDSDSSEENENHQIQELIVPESKQKTIFDQFHEALGAASTNEVGPMYAVDRHTGFGLFGKLQRVMQSEKEKDSYFLNKLQKEGDQRRFFLKSVEASCLDVTILSKSLEGKLTVCVCSSIENDESSTSTDDNLNIIKRKNMTIIFTSRICSDVELGVGTLVRIHPPWKEVNVKGNDESTILSTYFSNI